MDGIKLLSILTLTSNILIVLGIVVFLFSRLFNQHKYWNMLEKFIDKNSVTLSLVVSLVATLGSLYFSEIRNMVPCKFCWFQRIFMYPLPFILASGFYNKAKDVWRYVLPLSITGGFIALYHYYLQITPQPLAPCTNVGFSISCSERFFTHFGYITIPWMSLSAFTLISSFMLLSKIKSK